MSHISTFYDDKVVFLTGCTGVLGTCLVEKILRCLNIRELIIMIKPKAGNSSEKRLTDYLNNVALSRVDKRIINDKIACVYGDLKLDGFGLTPDDLSLIKNTANVIFHAAASVNFNYPLATALKINFSATKILLDIAADCKALQSFVYVSTAYSNFRNKLIEEKLYKQKYTPDFVQSMLDNLDDVTINNLAPTMLEGFPNTYLFSKGLTELLVEKYASKFPIGIIRPASLIPSYEDPFPGWINKGIAANTVILEAALGRVRILHSSNGDANVIPVDMCSNAILAIGWDCFTNRPVQSKIYNFASSNLRISEYMNYSLKNIQRNPLENTLYYPFLILTPSDVQFKILDFILHKIPAVILDTPNIILHRKLRALAEVQKTQAKMGMYTKALLRLDWIFKTDNVKNLWSCLDENEQRIFNFNLNCINWEEYLPCSLYGMKKYCLKEKMDEHSLHEARKHYNRLRNIHLLLKYGLLPLLVLKFASKL